MQIINYTLPQNNPNMSFKALQISSKAREEVAYMGRVVKDDYEKMWNSLAERIADTKFYDVVINHKLRPVFVEKATGIELRNVRLRSQSLDTIGLSADICNKNVRKTDSYFSIPKPENFIIRTKENKLIEDCNDVFKVVRALELYKSLAV